VYRPRDARRIVDGVERWYRLQEVVKSVQQVHVLHEAEGFFSVHVELGSDV